MPKLTKKAIDEAKPGAARQFLWDSELRGFGLVVQPSGTRSFCIQYRNAAGRERRMMLGRYGVLTVDEARRMAKAALADVAGGADPMGDKRAYREAPTLDDLFDRYLEEHVGPHNAAAAAAHEAAQRDNEAAQKAVSDAERRLAREEEMDSVAASLALLVEHGESLGLHDDHCPLCAAHRTSEEFAAGLAIARKRVASLSSGVQAARNDLASAKANAREPGLTLQKTAATVQAHADDLRSLRAQEAAHVEFYDHWKLDHAYIQDPEGLELAVASERDRLIDLERALLVLEASQAVSRMSSVESNIAVLRDDIEKLARAVGQSQSAVTAAREIERSVRRVSAEIIDERLAQISPLLNELYQRLRPHADWRTIDYSIRGDVRRFLSLKVGDGLNPQFVFSSGQRRAAGLAFLLSVHLARAWTPLRSLLLDDPVQHIDDFRALHLVEVLAALRSDGRQIICAVEDPALADLLSRRLISTATQGGRRVDIELGPLGATSVVMEREIYPMPVGVLRGVNSA